MFVVHIKKGENMGVDLPTQEDSENGDNVREFPYGAKPPKKTLDQQIKGDIKGRFKEGDIEVPEYVAGENPETTFVHDEDVEFAAKKVKEMDEDIAAGWGNVRPKDPKF